MLHQGYTYHKTMIGYSKQTERLKWGREGEKGGGGGGGGGGDGHH